MKRQIAATAAFITVFLIFTSQAMACNRYNDWIDNGDGTAFDPRANITWQNCSSPKANSNLCAENGKYRWMKYDEAMALAKSDRFLGRNDWRLPTRSELYKSADEWGCWRSNGVFSPIFGLATNRGSVSQDVLASPDANTYSSSNLNLGSLTVSGYNGGSSSGTAGFVILVRSDDNSSLNQFNEQYKNTIRLVEDRREKAAREAQQRESESSAAAAADRAYENRTRIFRDKVQAGDDTTSGIVTEVKGNLVKIQTSESQCTQRDYDGNCRNYVNTSVEKWFKRSEVFPRR